MLKCEPEWKIIVNILEKHMYHLKLSKYSYLETLKCKKGELSEDIRLHSSWMFLLVNEMFHDHVGMYALHY